MPMPVVLQRSCESLVGKPQAGCPGASLFCRLVMGAMCALLAQLGAMGSAVQARLGSAEFSAEANRLAPAETQGIRLDHGRAVIPCPLQRVEGVVDSSGLMVRSVSSAEGEGTVSLRVRSLGRTVGPATVPGPGIVSATSSLAKLTRSGMVEEFSTSVDGVRQDFVVLQSPPGSGALRLDLGLNGATVADAGRGVSLQLGSGRRLVYHRLRVTDATGRALAATMRAATATAIRIEVQDAGAAYPVRIDPTITDADWVSMSQHAGTNQEVDCIVFHGGDMYVGGYFTAIQGTWANRIAKWDGSSWSAFGTGLNSKVTDIAFDSSGTLHAAGTFTTAGGTPANGVAKWDGASWSSLGAGVNGGVQALVFHSSGDLYVGGGFTSAGGIPAKGIAKWNGTAWSALGSGVDSGYVLALACDTSGGLYAAGRFAAIGGVDANNVAKWAEGHWSALGTGLTGDVRDLVFDASEKLYAGGSDRVAAWDGTNWTRLGTGMSGAVSSLAFDGSGDLYAGGYFTTAGGNPANRLAKWDGTTWSALGTGLGSYVLAVACDASGNVYAGGAFTTAGGEPARNIAKWDASSWSTFGAGMDGDVLALVCDGSGNLYAGGEFAATPGGPANYVAGWDGTSWSALGTGMDGNVEALACDSSGNLYAGGEFSTAGGVTVNRIAKWDGTSWTALGSGANHHVLALACDSAGNLYAGGHFTTVDGISANRIAKWDGANWSALGDGVSSSVYSLAVATTGDLHVGGSFTTAGGETVNRVAKWDGSAWSGFGAGVDRNVHALALDPAGDLCVGGTFTTAGGATAYRAAKWDGSNWSQLGSGLNGDVYAMGIAATGELFAAGNFTSSGGVQTNRVARWNGTSWEGLGSGLTSKAYALAFDPAGALYVGGAFTTAGGKVSPYLAKCWIPSLPTAVADDYETYRNATLTVAAPGVLANDTDLGGGALTVAKVTDPAHGTLALAADGSFTYTPGEGYVGADGFTYQASDGTGSSDVITVTLSVTNRAPLAADDTYATIQGTPVHILPAGVLMNDSDPDGDALTATKVTDPGHGTVTFYSHGGFNYTPVATFSGIDSFTYQANDGLADSPVATVEITVKSTHVVEFVLAPHGTRTGGGTLVQTVVDGEAALAPELTVADGVTFTGWDVAFADVTGDLAVTAQYNAVPVAVDDSYSMLQDTALVVDASGVLANDTDGEGDPLTAIKVADPAHGTVALAADGSFTYTPTTGHHGADSFTYRANDGHADSAPATVAITVLETHAVTFDLGAHGTRTGGGALAQTVVHGDAAVAPEFTVTDGMTFTGWDVAFADVTGDLAVMAQYNAVPVVIDDSYSMLQDTELVVVAPGVLANDTDGEGDPLTAIKVADPAHGTVALASDGSFTYTPTAGYHGADSFTYKADDGHADSVPATVAITVRETHAVTFDLGAHGTRTGGGALIQTVVDGEAALAPEFTVVDGMTFTGWDVAFADVTGDLAVMAQYNAVPVVIDDSYSMLQDTELVVVAPGVLANDTDGEGDPLTAIKVTDPAHGTVALASDGSFTYTPTAGYHGADGFTYKANDGHADLAPATVAITVRETHAVTFDLGAHGTRTGGGALAQTVVHGDAAVAPEFTVTDGMTFTGWDVAFAGVSADLTVIAGYADTAYGLTVENGTGTGAYTEGTEITVTADEAPAGKEFAGWTVAPVDCAANLSGALSSTATFTMPGKAVTLTATYAYTAPEWTVDFTITDAIPTTLTFGMRGDATDGWDDGVDVQYPLPAFGQACLAAADLALSYSTDLHAPAETGEFLLIAKAGFVDLTVSWDVSGLPEGKFMTIYEVLLDHVTPERGPVVRTLVGNTALDVTLAESLTVPAGETRSYVIRYGDELVFDLLFEPGWNTVSLPIEPVSPALASVLDDAQAQGSRGALRGTVSRAQVWEWQENSYVAVAQMHACVGYWVYVAAGTVLLVRGTPVDQEAFDLSRGWNLCGSNATRPMPADSRVVGLPWGWHAAALRYATTTSLMPGLAYWINTAEDCVIPFAGD